METFPWLGQVETFDERRDLIIPGDHQATIHFCVEYFLAVGKAAINNHGFYAVALSGGSTPKAIFAELSKEAYRNQIDWSKVYLFWSDERAVPPSHPDSNFLMAMEAGFDQVPIPKKQIFRMEAEHDIDANARRYEELIKQWIPSGSFDLIMLGMGDDGHTASLFPKTHGLKTNERLAIANYIPQKETWRMSLTFSCINAAQNICIYVLGKSKALMVKKVLTDSYHPDLLPIQAVGTSTHKALWIFDKEAASAIISNE
jgi:6-phosphogluconolactonase